MIPFPGSNLSGTVLYIKELTANGDPNYIQYRSFVMLVDIVESDGTKIDKSFVRTSVPVSELGIKVGDRVCCYAFEEMGTDTIDGERMVGYEMTRGFTVQQPAQLSDQ